MKKHIALPVFTALVLSACFLPPKNRADDAPPLQAVERVDVDRYLGKWYEVARLPNSFEEGCEGVTAEYGLIEPGKLSVTNTCYDAVTGEVTDVAKGSATIVDGSNNAKLKVKFGAQPFAGDYWVIDLAGDYSWAIVSEPGGRFLWILSRTPTLPEADLHARIDWLNAQQYDTSDLVYPDQSVHMK